ncbi:MAG TPA: hypothetical protein VGM14_26945 [Streptosporangiaceae bacterium]
MQHAGDEQAGAEDQCGGACEREDCDAAWIAAVASQVPPAAEEERARPGLFP